MNQNNKRMAVKVAEDVLLWMRKRSFVVETGTYIWLEGEHNPDLVGESLKKLLPKLITTKTPCTVCALGA